MIRFVLLLTLLSCQTRPLTTFTRAELSQIELAPSSCVEEAILYRRLEQVLRPAASTKYFLTFHIEYAEKDLAIAKTSDLLRRGLTQKVTFTLSDKKNDAVLLQKTFNMHSSYSLIAEPMVSHGQMASNKNVLALRAAENIGYQLMMFFAKR
jgi:hypothetical protein